MGVGGSVTISKAVFNPQHKKVLDSFLLEQEGVTPGKMFGYPAYYVNKKLFACLYEEGVGIKLPEDKAKELVGKEGIIPFQPLGRRKMRQWIQINREDSSQYLDDKDIFLESVKFVAGLADVKN
jgi:hypothetical protein